MLATLGVQMFTLRRYTQSEQDLRTTLTRLREIGYTCVQMSGVGDVSAETVATLCQQADMRIVGSHLPWDRLRHDLQRVIDEHHLWQCTSTAVTRLPARPYIAANAMPADGLARYLDELAPISEALTAAGIRLGFHHQRDEFQTFGGATWLAQLFEQTTADQLKAELDTHWLAASGADPAQWIDSLGPRLETLHMKDLGINAQSQPVATPVGQGNLNWPGILAAAARQSVTCYMVGQDNCHGIDEFDCLQQSYDFLTRATLKA